MNDPRDPNETLAADADADSGDGRTGGDETTNPTIDLGADSLEVGLAAAFGKNAGPPRSSLGPMRPVLLKEAEGESSLVVKPTSDAMPLKDEAGDRYRFDGEIARGGMGVVLRGRDVDLGRDLAVKVLLEKYVNRPDVARRFIEEAQIGGQLQHPGVVPIYDIGKFGDRPFFTMKLVKGQTLAAILGERTDAAAEHPRLLGIALQVSQAMAYAHAKGVIHRDLKPANIMVGAFGEVQVMDWGLAKVLAEGGIHDEERASRAHQTPEDVTTIRTARSTGSHGSFGTDTEAGSILGTPAYMPPEQANGDIAHLDRRADVFGLGAILCETLTGKPPYVGRSAEEVRRKAANGDQADATARLDACGADAELIALTRKCLSPEAIDRPKDAQGVVDALTAHLDGVQERLQTAERERAVAMVREAEERKRRKVQLALAASVALLLLGGGSFGWWQSVQVAERRLAEERSASEKERLESERNAERAQRQLTEAQRAAADTARLARNAEAVTSLLAQCEEALKADDAPKAAVVLQAAKKRFAEGGAESEADRLERLDSDLALLRDLDAVDQFRWTPVENEFPDAAVVATRTREALKRFGAEPDAVSVDDAAARASASVVRERIVTALDRLLMPIRLVEWDKLSAEKPSGYTPQLRAAVAALLPKTPRVRAVLRLVDVDPYRDAIRDAVIAEDRAKFVELAGQKAALEQSPGFAAFLGDSRAIQVERRRQLLASAVRGRSGHLHLLMALGGTYPINQKDGADEPLRWYQAAVAAAPANAAAHTNLGLALEDKGQLDDAIASYEKAIELDPRYAAPHNNLGVLLCDDKRDYDGAIACCRRAIELDPKDAYAHGNLGNALMGKGQLDAAIACFKKAIEFDPKCAPAHCALGLALKDKGQWDEAIARWKKAIELDPKNAAAHSNLGLALKETGKLDEAIASCKKAIELDPKDAAAHINLGLALQGKSQLDEAIACYRKAIELGPKDALAHNNLGNALQDRGHLDEAIACYRKAIELDPKLAMAHNNLGNVLQGKSQLDEAIACYKTAIELDPKCAPAHCALGLALQGKGQWDEAIAYFKKAIELGFAPARPILAQAERAVAARDKFDDFQIGRYTPTTATERLALAEWCGVRKLNRTTSDLYAAAFAADPKLAEDLKAGHRYNAAFYAALAAAGQGEDAAKLGDAESTRLRQQALDWLRADLALYTNQLESGKPADRAEAQRHLRHWQKDTDLAGIRDAAALAKLPADEQKACTQLWADVAALLKNANAPPSLASLMQQLPEARTALPKDSPQLAGLLAQIGSGLLEQKKWTEAEPLLRECLAIREKTQPDVWSTFNTKSLLGGALLGQKKYADAEPLLLAGYEGMKQREKTILEQGKIRLPQAVERLVQLYEATGKTDEAAKWRKALEATKAGLKKVEQKPQ
jgi:eukaryotic-like serine/threonine-protein kinase